MDPEERRARLGQIMRLLTKSQPGLGLAGAVAEPVTGAARDVVLGWDEEKYLREKPRYPVGPGVDRAEVELDHEYRKQILGRLLAETPEEVSTSDMLKNYTAKRPLDPRTGENDAHEDEIGIPTGDGYIYLRRGRENKPPPQRARVAPRLQDDAPGSRRNR